MEGKGTVRSVEGELQWTDLQVWLSPGLLSWLWRRVQHLPYLLASGRITQASGEPGQRRAAVPHFHLPG